VVAYLGLGVRRDELNLIMRDDVNLEARTVQIDGTKTDGAKRVVAVNDTMVEVFRRVLKTTKPGKPLFAKWGKANRDLFRSAHASVNTGSATPFRKSSPPTSYCCDARIDFDGQRLARRDAGLHRVPTRKPPDHDTTDDNLWTDYQCAATTSQAR
jgi:hypothetical protein